MSAVKEMPDAHKTLFSIADFNSWAFIELPLSEFIVPMATQFSIRRNDDLGPEGCLFYLVDQIQLEFEVCPTAPIPAPLPAPLPGPAPAPTPGMLVRAIAF